MAKVSIRGSSATITPADTMRHLDRQVCGKRYRCYVEWVIGG